MCVRLVIYNNYFFIIKLASLYKLSNHHITSDGKIILTYGVCKFRRTTCIRENSSHLKSDKYLMNKSYNISFLININKTGNALIR